MSNHITSRGNGRKNIYLTDHDRELFLSLLSEVHHKHNWYIHAYCLMSNHYHVLIETPRTNLSKGMQYLNGVYTQRFNRTHHRVGHVFQGRYKSILVEKENYLLELARYIVLNPVRAKMVLSASDWIWSSYLPTVGQIVSPTWLNTDWILSVFGDCRSTSMLKYKQFVDEACLDDSPWGDIKQQIYLGSDAFIAEAQLNINPVQNFSEFPSPQYAPVFQPLIKYEQLAPSRNEAIKTAYASGSYTMKELGHHFGLHYSRISKIVNLK